MPYCPKCDMEFVEGITVCSDCLGPLAESEEAAEAAKKEELKGGAHSRKQEEDGAPEEWDTRSTAGKPVPPPAVYVKKSQKYEDLKSSAYAFLVVGGAIAVFALLCWTGILSMPMAGISKYLSQGILTAMGAGCLIISALTLRSAKSMTGEISEEEKQTEELISWFISTWRGEDIDSRLDIEFSDLIGEERSLKRFELIQDLLITSKDLPDPAYVDALCEEIYSKLFDE